MKELKNVLDRGISSQSPLIQYAKPQSDITSMNAPRPRKSWLRPWSPHYV